MGGERPLSHEQLRRICEQDELVRAIVESRQCEVKALVDDLNAFFVGVMSHVLRGTPAPKGRDEE